MIDPSLLLASLDGSMHVDLGGERDDADPLDAAGVFGASTPWASAGAYDSWPWRPPARTPYPQPSGHCEMPPPCPMHADRTATRPVYTGTPPPGWVHTMQR